MKLIDNGFIEQKDKSVSRYKCRKWLIRVRTDQGRKSKYFIGSLSEAKTEKDKFIEKLLNDDSIKITFKTYAEKWLKWRKCSNFFSPNTIEKDERLIKNLNIYFAFTPLSDFTPELIKNTIMDFRGIKNQKLSNSYLKMCFGELNKILKSAVYDGIIQENPMKNIILPKNDTQEKRALTKDELNELLKQLNNEPLDGRIVCIFLMCYLGLRRSECLGLYWEHINFDERELNIKQAYKNANHSIGKTKSKSAIRTLPIPKPLYSILEEWEKEIHSLDKNCKLVCPNTNLTLMRGSTMKKWYKRFCKRNNREKITFHELRHTNLTIVSRHMSIFDLQKYAGWSSIAPAKIYIHDDYQSLKKSLKSLF